MKVRDWPNGAETTYGPYSMANPVDMRIAARQMKMRVEFTAAGRWGPPRFDVVEGGRR
jgi:hypothetical protein